MPNKRNGNQNKKSARIEKKNGRRKMGMLQDKSEKDVIQDYSNSNKNTFHEDYLGNNFNIENLEELKKEEKEPPQNFDISSKHDLSQNTIQDKYIDETQSNKEDLNLNNSFVESQYHISNAILNLLIKKSNTPKSFANDEYYPIDQNDQIEGSKVKIILDFIPKKFDNLVFNPAYVGDYIIPSNRLPQISAKESIWKEFLKQNLYVREISDFGKVNKFYEETAYDIFTQAREIYSHFINLKSDHKKFLEDLPEVQKGLMFFELLSQKAGLFSYLEYHILLFREQKLPLDENNTIYVLHDTKILPIFCLSEAFLKNYIDYKALEEKKSENSRNLESEFGVFSTGYVGTDSGNKKFKLAQSKNGQQKSKDTDYFSNKKDDRIEMNRVMSKGLDNNIADENGSYKAGCNSFMPSKPTSDYGIDFSKGWRSLFIAPSASKYQPNSCEQLQSKNYAQNTKNENCTYSSDFFESSPSKGNVSNIPSSLSFEDTNNGDFMTEEIVKDTQPGNNYFNDKFTLIRQLNQNFAGAQEVATSQLGKSKRLRWTKEDDSLLVKAVNNKIKDKVGHCNPNTMYKGIWHSVSETFGDRTSKQCRDRYLNYLVPNLKKSPLSTAEKIFILTKHREIGGKWVEIAGWLNNRSENICKNFYNGVMRKLQSKRKKMASFYEGVFLELCEEVIKNPPNSLPSSLILGKLDRIEKGTTAFLFGEVEMIKDQEFINKCFFDEKISSDVKEQIYFLINEGHNGKENSFLIKALRCLCDEEFTFYLKKIVYKKDSEQN